MKANSGSSVSFMIIPRELGYIMIKATANSILAGDSVERKLLVKVMCFISFSPYFFCICYRYKIRFSFFLLG